MGGSPLSARFVSALTFSLFLFIIAARPCLAEDIPDKAFEDWKTFTYKDKSLTYISFTPDTKERGVELHLAKYQGKCETTRMFIFVTFSSQAEKDYDQDNIEGELRVDQQQVRKVVARCVYKKGEKYGTYNVHTFENPQTLLREMAGGQMVRFRFKIKEQEYYFRFSLKGFGQSFDRLGQLCAQQGASQERKPSKPKPEGAQKPAQPKGDADFFGPSKNPEGKSGKTDKDFF